jgi:dTMP kinase
VIYLDMPTEESVRLLRSRETATHTKGDIHEVDTEYLALCRQTALRAAQHYGWHKVSCVDEQGQVRSIQDLHDEIWSLVIKYVPSLQA